MGFLKKLFGKEEKLWRVGGHRVKENEEIVRGSAPHGVSDKVAGRTKIRYQCVDCHKRSSSREKFKHMECYEIVDE